ARVAGLHRPRPHPPSLRGPRLHARAQRAAHLLDRDHPRALGHAAGASHPAPGRRGPPPGHLRADRHRRAGDRGAGTRPVRGSFAGLAGRFRGLLHLDDPPRRLAIALAVGVFISCTPFLGLQTLLAVAVAAAFRLNRAATLLGTWLNLPWFAPLVYGAAIKIGFVVAPGLSEADAASWDLLLRNPGALSWATVWSWLR